MNYKYRAIDSSGKKISGNIAARDKAAAISALKGRGLTPLYVKEINERTGNIESSEPAIIKRISDMEFIKEDNYKIKLKSKTVLGILNQFAVLTKAGIPLTVSMQVLLSQEKDRRGKKILAEIQEDLLAGRTLSDSMAKFRAFNEVTVNVISAGEANGRLDEAFERASKILENEVAITQKVRSAMGYPVFLLCLTFTVITILNLVVLPIFANMFQRFGRELPFVTKVIMSGSDLFLSYWYLFALFVILGISAYFYARRNSRNFREKTDQLVLKLPLIGDIFEKVYISRFGRVMSSLTGAGVEIIHALTMAARVIPNTYIRQFFNKVLEDVKVGMPISTSMRRYPIFDSLLISMISAGEESGNLPGVLDKIAEVYERQTESQVKLFTTLIEPAMTVIIAIVVGVVVISVVVPMFQQYSLML